MTQQTDDTKAAPSTARVVVAGRGATTGKIGSGTEEMGDRNNRASRFRVSNPGSTRAGASESLTTPMQTKDGANTKEREEAKDEGFNINQISALLEIVREKIRVFPFAGGGDNSFARRRRTAILVVIVALLVLCFLALHGHTGTRTPTGAQGNANQAQGAVLPGATTAPGSLILVSSTITVNSGMLTVAPPANADLDAAHARDAAAGFAGALWTFDYRYPDQYLPRLTPYCEDTKLLDQLNATTKSPANQSDHLIESGLFLSSASSVELDFAKDRKSVAARVSLIVNVFKKSNTTGTAPQNTPVAIQGATDLVTDHALYQAQVSVELTLAVDGNSRWMVTAYHVAPQSGN